MEDVALQLKIDVERRTTRGRSCPRCGGKIIPSRRAVYQSSGDPNAIFPSWQCERCGYEELIAKPVKAAPKHGVGADKKAPAAPRAPSVTTAAAEASAPPGAIAKPPATRAVPALKDRKGRALPPDVNRMMAEMNREKAREEGQ